MTAESEHPKCPDCGYELDTPALALLHRNVHSGSISCPLRYVPYTSFRAVAEVMQEYADHQSQLAADRIAELHEMLVRQQNLTDEVIRDLKDERKKNRISEGGRV